MRAPLAWLRDYVDIDVDPDDLARRLTMLGLEVSAIERWGDDWDQVVVGELLTVAPHPRADRLSLTTVTVGTGETLEIVCGATNIAPGQRVPVALPGAVLPGGRRIERSEKMGVVSNGMLCSGDELRLTGDADGILILPVGTPIGRPLVDLYGDWILDVDVKPNRGDLLSMVGLAREVAAATGASARFPAIDVVEDGPPIADALTVEVLDERLCPRFVGRRVAGVSIGPSPEIVQMRLRAAGVRPISNVVDVSNYVMLELGKPIHTFDAAGVRGGRIVVRRAIEGERLETLDHLERDLDPDTLLIADPEGPLAIAGIMGGAASEIGPTTTDVVIESAIFDPVAIRRTGHRYALRSEASLRFEKGQEWRMAAVGADRTAMLVHEWAGGTVARGRIDSAPVDPAPRRVAFRPGRIDRLLGTAIGPARQAELLGRVGIVVEAAPGGTRIDVAGEPQPQSVQSEPGEAEVAVLPGWRLDIAIEADVAEEVARIHGYEAVPPTRPDTQMPSFRRRPTETRDAVREMLVGAGLTEVVGHALTSPSRDAELRPTPALAAGSLVVGEESAGDDPIRVSNPLSRERSVLRRSLVDSLLEVVAANERAGRSDIAVFEVGKGYARSGDAVHEWWRLGIALSGAIVGPHWTGPARVADLADAKGVVELVASGLGFDGPTYAAARTDPLLHPGRTATVLSRSSDGAPAIGGFVGEIHPGRLAALAIRAERVVVAELAVAGLSAGSPPRWISHVGVTTAEIERDVAVVVPEATDAGAILALIRAAGGDDLREAVLFDIYRGAPLADGEKSLAVRLVFGGSEELTPERTEADLERVRSAVAGLEGVRLRS